jgi:hypothetical protein
MAIYEQSGVIRGRVGREIGPQLGAAWEYTNREDS